jgi:2-amino-4-hydroxy-6-hydroxymethyldihydropteridine diphosphokinase
MPRAFVGMGANVGEAATCLRWAAAELGALGVVRLSSFWSTAPTGPVADQPWFLNAVCALETDRSPEELLGALLAIEARAGRDRSRETPQGPRRLDLDLLLYDDLVHAAADGSLIVPHPRLHDRAFALAPLGELAGGDLVIPGAGRLADLLERALRTQPIAKIV